MTGIVKQLAASSGLAISPPTTYSGGVSTVIAGYTITDTDGYDILNVTTGASTIAIVLPSAATNGGRIISIRKADAGAGKITLTRAGSDTISGLGYTTTTVADGTLAQTGGDRDTVMTVMSDGVSNWVVLVAPASVFSADPGTNVNCTTSNQYKDFASLLLPAGTWDLFGQLVFALNGATQTACEAGISSTSGNSGTGLTYGTTLTPVLPPNSNTYSPALIVPFRIGIASATTYYLKGAATYSAGTPVVRAGQLWARRVTC